MDTCAILMPNWIGDYVMALSVVIARAERTGTAPVLVVPRPLVALSNALYGAAPIVPYDRDGPLGWLRTARGVRKHRPHTLYLLPHSFSSALFALLTGVARRRGVIRDGRRMLLSDALPRKTRRSKRHLTIEYATVLECDPPKVEDWSGRPVGDAGEYAGAIVLCPGAQYGPAKQWQGFAGLAASMPDQRFVVLGGRGDREEGEKIVAASGSNTRNLAGETSLVEAAGILSGATCVVSNDSGLMHLAGFVGAPVVGIFGSTRPSWTRPLGSSVEIAYTGEECSPCFDRTCRLGHYRCLAGISVEAVANMVRKVAHGSG